MRTRAAKRRVGCDDDTIPNDAQDFDEWIGTKMLELRDANDVGDLESVIHLTSLISQGAFSHEDEGVATFSVVEYGGFVSSRRFSSPCVSHCQESATTECSQTVEVALWFARGESW